jgi:hypothetical protein
MPFMTECGQNLVQADRPQVTIWRMRIACWITKATDTHVEYVLLIAFGRQRRLRERASALRIYVHCLACCVIRSFMTVFTTVCSWNLSWTRRASTNTHVVFLRFTLMLFSHLCAYLQTFRLKFRIFSPSIAHSLSPPILSPSILSL